MRLVLMVCVLVCLASSAWAGEAEVFLKSGYFDWKETISGKGVIRERGLVSGAGIAYTGFVGEKMFIRPSFEVWGGNIDYQGFRVGTWAPLEGDTTYFGTAEEVRVGLKLPVGESFSVSPFAALGHKFWLRSLSVEDWNSFYGRIGVRGETKHLFAEGGVTLPVYTRVHTDWSSDGYNDFVTKPKNKPSAFAEAGATFGQWRIGAFYEQIEFGQSDTVRVEKSSGSAGAVLVASGAFQPDSVAHHVGLKVGFSF